MVRGTTSLGRKRKKTKKASHKNRAVELKVRPIRTAKWLFLQSFLKIIFITVLSTAVFWWFLSIPKPYTRISTYGESVTHNWCPQVVLLHYFAMKVTFEAFYWMHFSTVLYGKSQTMLIISRGECNLQRWSQSQQELNTHKNKYDNLVRKYGRKPFIDYSRQMCSFCHYHPQNNNNHCHNRANYLNEEKC